MTRFLARILGFDAQTRAQVRLERIVQEARNSEAVRSYRKRRAAQLNAASRRAYSDGIDAWFARGGK